MEHDLAFIKTWKPLNQNWWIILYRTLTILVVVSISIYTTLEKPENYWFANKASHIKSFTMCKKFTDDTYIIDFIHAHKD